MFPFYISSFDEGDDGTQPHNFIMANGEILTYHYPMDYWEKTNLSEQYAWINTTYFGLPDDFLTDNLTENFHRSLRNPQDGVIIINTSSAKFKIELLSPNGTDEPTARPDYSGILILGRNGPALFNNNRTGNVQKWNIYF